MEVYSFTFPSLWESIICYGGKYFGYTSTIGIHTNIGWNLLWDWVCSSTLAHILSLATNVPLRYFISYFSFSDHFRPTLMLKFSFTTTGFEFIAFLDVSLSVKYPNTKLFLVRIFLYRMEYGDFRSKSLYSIRMQENTD